ncbi:peptidylprolyl isomerase [Cohnella sp. GCM10027633]|uniref:foldase protein PrsA n=1 Tax=unclassified Cohnella TaxID=2636738 RepID=UPI003632E0E2
MNEENKDQANTPASEERGVAETLNVENAEQAENEVAATAEAAVAGAGAGVVVSAPQSPMSAKPWIGVSVVAVAALAFVLIANPFGGSSDKLGTFDGGAVTKNDFYEEIKAQVPAEQFTGMVDSIIEKKLIAKLADKAGLAVTDEEISKEIGKYETNFGGAEAFQQALDQNGIDLATFKAQQIIPMVLKTKLYAEQHPATEDDFKKYFEDNQNTFATTPKQVKASHILVATQEEADAILADLKAGQDFATIAKAKSVDTGSAVNGGELGDFFGPGAMVPEFEEAAFKLNKGEISEVVPSEYGFHIIKVTDVKEAVVPPYDEKKADVENAYWTEQLGTNESEWLDKLKEDNNAKNLVEEKEPAASPSASPAASPSASAPAESAPASSAAAQ